MKKWAMVVLVLYGLIILIFTLPVCILAFQNFKQPTKLDSRELIDLFNHWPYWTGFFLFLVSQAALLDIRVNTIAQRPVNKRNIIPVILFSSLMMALLIAGAVLAINETITKNTNPRMLLVIIPLGVSWLAWGVIFYRWSRNPDAQSFLDRILKTLFRGSILELLVAVPTHIIARYRDYCCAGFNTFVGIVFGLAVMLCSFGPGVFFLFAERWKRLHSR